MGRQGPSLYLSLAVYDDGQAEREVEVLPLELQRYIEEDHWRVEQEMAELEEQSCKMAQMEQSPEPLESQNLSSDLSQGERRSHSAFAFWSQQTGS